MNLSTFLTIFLIFVGLPVQSLLPPEIIKHPAREVAVVISLPKVDIFPPFYRRSEYIKKSFTLECEAVGDPNPKYRWSKNGMTLSQNYTISNGRVRQVPGKGTLEFSYPHEDDAGNYQCFAENKRGTASSDTASVLIVWSDIFKEKVYNLYVGKTGLPLKIPCTIPNGWPKWQVYWLKGFKPIEDDRIKEDPEGNLLFAFTEIWDTTRNSYFRCVGKTAYLSIPVVSVRLTVEDKDEGLSTYPLMTQLVAQYVSPKIEVAISGQPAALYCIYGGNPIPFVKWSKNSTTISVLDKNTRYDDTYMSILRIPQVQLSDQSNYTCNVTSIKSEIYSNTTTLIVHEAPIFIETPQNINVSKGETAILNCSATGIPEPKVTWYKNGVMIWSNENTKRRRNDDEDQRLRIYEFSLKIDEVIDKDTGNYACNVSNIVGYIFKDVYINVTKAKPKSKLMPIATTLVIAALVVIIFASIWVIKARKRKEQMVRLAPETPICLDTTPVSKSDPWQFNRARLMLLDVIGEGNFGKVFLAEAVFDAKTGGKTKHNVAVKTTHVNAPDCARVDLLHELDILKNIQHHLNVVKLIGACTETSPTFLIMELLSESLHQFLRKARTKKYYELPVGDPLQVKSQLLLSFALQTAKGMHHINSQGIIHRDLAARNVLLNSDLVCKVADFGLARKVNSEEIYATQSNTPLPIRWMAPESLRSNETSVKSDVWSYGVLLWELATLGATPYPGKGCDEVRQMICEGECMDKPKTCEIELHSVMLQCWHQEPQQRPDFSACSDLLASLLETDADYIQLDDFPDHEYLVVEQVVGETV